MSRQDTTSQLQSLADGLIVDERVALIAGRDMWHTPAIDDRSIPALRMTDGPAGARGTSFEGAASASLPCGTALAATFDPELVHQIGVALGREARAKRAHVLLAPTVNLHRTPLGGRSFECFSEDPIHSARLAVAYIEGVQSERVACCVKHFVGNDSEHERMTVSSDIDERTLRELYLVPFEAAVRRAGVRSVMTAYNRLNGTYCSEHPWLLETLLRGEWGFDGLVVSDWFGTHSNVPALVAGLDVEMPGPPLHRRTLLDDLTGDLAEQAALERASSNVLALLDWSAAATTGTDEEATPDDPELRELLRRAATASFVLLKNDPADGGSPILPLARERLRIAVIGPNGQRLRIQGGGSAGVVPSYETNLVDELRARGHQVTVEPGVNIDKVLPPLHGDFHATLPSGEVRPWTSLRVRDEDFAFGDEPTDRGPITVDGTFTATVTGTWDVGVRAVGPLTLWIEGDELIHLDGSQRGGSFFGLGSPEVTSTFAAVAGQTYRLSLRYEPGPDDLIRRFVVGARPPITPDLFDRAVAAAADADVALVVVGTNNDWETEGEDRTTLQLPGDQDGLVRAVAAANPNTVAVVNTGSAVTMDWIDDIPAVMQVWFAGQEMGAALADVLVGSSEPTGRLPLTFPRSIADTPTADTYPGDGVTMPYSEGLHIGHRWYEAHGTEPLFWFGHGLGYGEPVVTVDTVEGAPDTGVQVRVIVTNTGERSGTEVVQVYVSSPDPDEPPKRFAGSTKVTVEPGAQQTVAIDVDPWVFRTWRDGQWVIPSGEHTVWTGTAANRVDEVARLTV